MGKVLHASKSGYFTSCILDGSPKNKVPYIKTNLYNAMALWWRVKTWELTITGIVDYAQVHYEYFGEKKKLQFNPEPYPLNEEKDFVCLDYLVYYADYPGELDGQYFDTQVEFSPGFWIPPTDNDAPEDFQKFYLDKKSKNLDFYMLFGLSFAAVFNYTNSGDYIEAGSLTIKFLDQEITNKLYMFAGPENQGNAIVTLNAKEYWSYGKTWNTTTGKAPD